MASRRLLHFRPKHHRHFSSNNKSFLSDINSNPNPNNPNPNPNNPSEKLASFDINEVRRRLLSWLDEDRERSRIMMNERLKKLREEEKELRLMKLREEEKDLRLKKLREEKDEKRAFEYSRMRDFYIKIHDKKSAAQRINATPSFMLSPPKEELVQKSTLPSDLNELKEACGSDDLADAFKWLFSQEMTEEEGFLIRMEEECSQLRAKIDKREQMMNEADSFGPFHKVATDGHGCLFEIQMKDRQKLEALTAILVAAREGLKDKDRYVKLMEYDKDQEDD